MADFINADEAKAILGCDDATLNNYVNNGTIRAQRDGGALQLHREDVENLSGMSFSDSDDGTIILSGDSEDLSIDLGEVVDDSAVTMVHSTSDAENDSITFGDELEVVSFDDDLASGTEELSFDDSDATQNLTFTDSNTAIATDIDETVVGTATATATSDFQTVDYGDDDEDDEAMVTGASVRRSVRSQRVRSQAPKTHWIWPTILILSMLIVSTFPIPYFYLAQATKEDTFYVNGETKRGTTDHTIWTGIADSIAQFSCEPNPETYRNRNPDGEWISIAALNDPTLPDLWRYKEWRGDGKWTAENRPDSFIIKQVEYQQDPENDDEMARFPVSASSLDANGSTMITFTVTKDESEGAVTYKLQQ